MTWTYDHTMQTPTDRVRLSIGDTDDSDQQMQDEEIAVYLQDTASDPLKAAYECALALAARYSRQADVSVGQVHTRASQRQAQYLLLAARLRTRTTGRPATGALSTTAPTSPPIAGAPDRNDSLYQGDPYQSDALVS